MNTSALNRLITILVCFFLTSTFNANAQLIVATGSDISLTPTQFVQTYLVGTGITILPGATFNSSAEPLNSLNRIPLPQRDQIGSFTASGSAETQLGIAGGVIMSSGYVANAKAGLNPSHDIQPGNQPAESDPDLVILATPPGNPNPTAVHDRSVLEFDFIPQTNIVTFRYVFGSIEFDTFCGSINDAFGLFLSGPGISGGLGFINDAVNIALLPGGTSYVNIFNICAADQGNLGDGVYSWWNTPKVNFSYNRLSHVFTATYTVQCNLTYRMKFAIGDASDGILDSGVFLEQNSFSSNNIEPDTSFTNNETGQLLVPGCSNATLIYLIPQPGTTDLLIDLVIDPSGTATQSDILPNPFPAQTIIPAGSLQSPPILIQALTAPQGPDKSLIIKASTSTCGIPSSIFTPFTIKYNATLAVSLPPQSICMGSSATLTPVVTGGQVFIPSNVYHYLWSTGATTPSITVSPGIGVNTYSVTVTDACGVAVTTSTTVTVGSVPPAPGNISGEISICIPATGKTYSIAALPYADSYIWTIPAGGTIIGSTTGNSIDIDFGIASVSGNVTVMGHNNACGDGTVATLAVALNPLPVVNFPSLLPVCIDALPFPLVATPPGGVFTGPGVIGPLFNPGIAGAGVHTITYTYTDANGCTSGITSNIMVNPLPVVTLSNFADVCIGTPAFILTGGTPAGGLYSGTGVTAGSFNPASAGPGSHLITYSYADLNGCSSLATNTILVGGLPDVDFTGPVSPVTVCQDYPTPYRYQVAASPSTTYTWSIPAPFTANGTVMPVTGFPNMADVVWTVAGSAQLKLEATTTIGCQDSKTKTVIILAKPAVALAACFDLATTTNAKPFLLKGGSPMGNNGRYYIDGTLVPGSLLDPSTLPTGNHIVTFTYTDAPGCIASDTTTLKVGPSNASYTCPANFFTDPRNSDPNTNRYPTTTVTANGRTTCWMLKNLNWGTLQTQINPHTDNCITEKYCEPGDNTCSIYGAYYQWDELMQYGSTPGWPKGVCPPGWHIPTTIEWQDLIDANTGNGQAGSTLKDLNISLGFHGILSGIFYFNNLWAFTSTQSITGSMFWTSTLAGTKPVARGLNYYSPSVSWYESSRANAFPVRCVKD